MVKSKKRTVYMRYYGLLIMLFLATNSFAQNGYWQQKVDYKMEIDFNAKKINLKEFKS